MAATMLGSLLVSLGLESGQFSSGLSAAEKDLKKSIKRIEAEGAKVGRIGRNLSLGITLPLAAIGAAAFKTASDVAELEGAFDATFGSMAKSMREWAVQTGDTLGRSTQEIQASLVAYQELFSKAFDPAKAAEMSKQFAVLTQDLASFKNLSNEVAQQKLFSGLVGEAEPLRAVGVLLSENAVKAKAVELGLAGAKDELSEQTKVSARAALILEQLSTAQGDVIRTSSSTENQIKAARAAFQEMQVVIGTKLLPTLTPLISALTDVLVAFNQLPESVQTGVIGIAAFAAVLGPTVTVIASVVTGIRSFIATASAAAAVATAAGTATTTFSAALTLLRTRLIALITTLGPYALAVAAIGGIIYLVTSRTEELTEAQKAKANAAARSAEADRVATDSLQKLANATKQQREELLKSLQVTRAQAAEALRAAKANLDHARSMLAVAKAAAQADVLKASQTVRGAGADIDTTRYARGRFERIVSPAQAKLDKAERLYAEGMGALDGLDRILKDSAAPVKLGSAVAGDGKGSKAGKDRTDELAARAAQDRYNLEIEQLRAQADLTTDVEERAEFERQILAKERDARYDELDASVKSGDLNKAQADAQREILEKLYGKRDAEAKDGEIIVEGQKTLYGQKIERDRRLQLFQDENDLAEARYRAESDALRNEYDLADTDADRKRIAMRILDAEDAYLRAKLSAVVANNDLAKAVRDQAQIELDALNASSTARRAVVSRQNETEVESYLRSLKKTPEKMNEAIDAIKIEGLQSLNNQIADAIVNFKSMGDVFANVIKQMIADLIRLQLQKTLIAPLAKLLGLGDSAGLFAGNSSGGIKSIGKTFGGARALGGPVSAGKVYLTSEDGPELFQPGRSGRIISNRDLQDLGVGASTAAGIATIVPSPYFDVVVDGRASAQVARAAPGIASAGASGGVSQIQRHGSRRLA